jgi:hypothetical protein
MGGNNYIKIMRKSLFSEKAIEKTIENIDTKIDLISITYNLNF